MCKEYKSQRVHDLAVAWYEGPAWYSVVAASGMELTNNGPCWCDTVTDLAELLDCFADNDESCTVGDVWDECEQINADKYPWLRDGSLEFDAEMYKQVYTRLSNDGHRVHRRVSDESMDAIVLGCSLPRES